MHNMSLIHDVEKISEPKRSVTINDRFVCTSGNVIYCTTCTLCKKLYIGKTGKRLGDRFREHFLDVAKNYKNASNPDARHLSLPNHPNKKRQSVAFPYIKGAREAAKL